MPKEESSTNNLIPLALTALISAGGTSAVHKIGGEETIINSATIEQCSEFIIHGKNHQRVDDSINKLDQDLKQMKKDILNEIKILILENKKG